MLAVASGITGAGLAKASEIGRTIGEFRIFPAPASASSWFSVFTVATYSICGFYFMYFARVVVINPRLAKGKRALDEVKISSNVSVIAININEKLPQSLLLGRMFIEEVDELDTADAESISSGLFSEDVNLFLDACEKDASSSAPLAPAITSMAARLHYYRVYFKRKDTMERQEQETKAVDWVTRALMRDPTEPDLQIKLADLFALSERYEEAASIIEKLERNEDAPQFIQQWTGYFLLFIEGREKDAIRHSLEFHDRFSDGSSALYNVACGYAQLYAIELDEAGTDSIPSSPNREESLKYLRQARRIDSQIRTYARKEAIDEGDSLYSLRNDPEFIRITSEPAEKLGTV
jgi:tetratricopeptide (TPR) repeat protein